MGYNFDGADIDTDGACGSGSALVDFYRADGVRIGMTFTKWNSEVYLSKVIASYDTKNLPNHKHVSDSGWISVYTSLVEEAVSNGVLVLCRSTE